MSQQKNKTKRVTARFPKARARRSRAPTFGLPFDVRPPEIANALRDQAMSDVAVKAQDERPRFHQQAVDFVLWFLDRFGPAPGERITDACKRAGIQPHDDRAFGPVYMALARQKRIEKIGSVRRERGHGTSGGNIWALKVG
jgi:hypothetical protein